MSNVINEMIHVPVKNIMIPELLLRDAQTEDEKYLTLKGSIEESGVRTPLLVSPGVTPDTYILSDGMQRLTISKELGLETVPVRVENLSESDGYLAQLEMNLTKVDVKMSQYSRILYQYAQKFPNATIPELSRRLKVSANWLRERLEFPKLSPAVQAAVDDGAMAMSKAILLKGMDFDQQDRFIEKAAMLQQDSFAQQVTEQKKEIAKAKREGRAPAIAEYVPEARNRAKADLLDELENQKYLPALVAGLDPVEAALVTLKWVLRLDPESVAAGRKAWEEEKAAAKAKAELKKAEREAKAKASAEAGETVRG